jgi:hypothetical protein
MRTLARVLWGISCCLVLFVAGLLATFKVNLLIYGVEKFNGNAGAGLAVLIEGIFAGLILAVCGIPLSIIVTKRLPWFRVSN